MSSTEYSLNKEWGTIVSQLDNGELNFFSFSENQESAYFQYVKRDISKELTFLEEGKYYDIITPFDYGAFYYTSETILKKALQHFLGKCNEENIISGFFRFNPMINQNYEILNQYIDIIALQKHIVIDLIQEYQKDFSKRKIRNINKAKQYQYQFIIDDSIESFYDIYLETMNRVESSQYFLFSKDTLEQLIRFGKIFSIQFEDRVVSSLFIIEDQETVFYFLGGTRSMYLNFGLNSLLFDLVCKYYLNQKKYFFLGGGHPNLYQFKKEFSSKTQQFYIGKKIFNNELYEKLVRDTKREDNNFFPQYREKIV